MTSELLEAELPTTLSPEQRNLNHPSISASGPIFDAWNMHIDGRRWYFQLKYIVEQLIGCILLIPFSPLIGILWVAVRLTSQGPGFYRQTRVGLNGETFLIVKLRTMFIDAEAAGIKWCSHGDPRITPLGYWLRKLHLDELPQLWNVACGHMCLVGPRPERPEITSSLEKLIPGYQLRHRVKPGVTGLAQVNLEPDSDINLTRKKQILDLRYISVANFWLDVRLLVATLARMFGIRGERAMRWNRLKQDISERELVAIGYEFNADSANLWNPTKGPL